MVSITQYRPIVIKLEMHDLGFFETADKDSELVKKTQSCFESMIKSSLVPHHRVIRVLSKMREDAPTDEAFAHKVRELANTLGILIPKGDEDAES